MAERLRGFLLHPEPILPWGHGGLIPPPSLCQLLGQEQSPGHGLSGPCCTGLTGAQVCSVPIQSHGTGGARVMLRWRKGAVARMPKQAGSRSQATMGAGIELLGFKRT